MFDLGFDELLVIAVVAIVVIGPKDLPMALRTVGRWVAKVRRISGHFRTGVETMIREAELEEMERQWKAQNEAIMREHPAPHDLQAPAAASAETAAAERPAPEAEAQLPLPPP